MAAEPNELPQMVTDLVDMSKEYLRQETLEPAKKLGRFAGMSIGAGALLAFVALFTGLATYALFRQVLPEGDWWVVAARGFTVLVTAGLAGLLGWRMSK